MTRHFILSWIQVARAELPGAHWRTERGSGQSKPWITLKAGPPALSLFPCPASVFECPSVFLSTSLCSAPSVPLCVFSERHVFLSMYFSFSLLLSFHSPWCLCLSLTFCWSLCLVESLCAYDCLSASFVPLLPPPSPHHSPHDATATATAPWRRLVSPWRGRLCCSAGAAALPSTTSHVMEHLLCTGSCSRHSSPSHHSSVK